MPYVTDTQSLQSPFLKRSVKLLPCQKEMICYWSKQGYSQRRLAKMFHVSRRLITFVLDPKKLAKNKERREERGGTMQYYDKDKHKAYMKEHRTYKYKTLK